MIKTIEIGGVTEVKIKDSPYSMERFCRVKNLSENVIFASCENQACEEDQDGVRRISAGESEIIDTENYDTVYLNGTGKAEIITSAYANSLFRRTLKGGETGGSSGLHCVTDKLAFSLTTTFSNFQSEVDLGSPSDYGINLGIAERTVEIVNTCGDSDNFIISYGNGDKGQTVALSQTEFVGYYNGAIYAGNVSAIMGKTRYICFVNYDKICKIYVNGIKTVDTEFTYSCAPNDNMFSLNRWKHTPIIAANGCTTHELKIYNKILTENEIKNNLAYYSSIYTLS